MLAMDNIRMTKSLRLTGLVVCLSSDTPHCWYVFAIEYALVNMRGIQSLRCCVLAYYGCFVMIFHLQKYGTISYSELSDRKLRHLAM